MTYRDRKKPWESRERFRKDAQREVKKRNFAAQYGGGLASLKRRWAMVEEEPELVLEEFTSWDQLSPGDELMWVVDGKPNDDYHMEFISRFSSDGSSQLIRAKYLSGSPGWGLHQGQEDDVDARIYPDNTATWANSVLGWKRVVKEIPYDPNGQGETEDDI